MYLHFTPPPPPDVSPSVIVWWTFSDGFGDKPSHSIRCVYRAEHTSFHFCMPPSLPRFFVVSLCPGSFPWGCSVVPNMHNLQHYLSAHCSHVYNHHLCLLRCSSFAHFHRIVLVSVVVLVVFLCIRLCYQQSGDWKEILHLSSRYCSPSLTF